MNEVAPLTVSLFSRNALCPAGRENLQRPPVMNCSFMPLLMKMSASEARVHQTIAALQEGVYVIGMKDQFNVHDLRSNPIQEKIQYIADDMGFVQPLPFFSGFPDTLWTDRAENADCHVSAMLLCC